MEEDAPLFPCFQRNMIFLECNPGGQAFCHEQRQGEFSVTWPPPGHGGGPSDSAVLP